jgi:hypothetical protein
MAWAAIKVGKDSLKDYVLMQCIKRNSTLRIGPKGEKPTPRIVYRYGSQDDRIKAFLDNRRLIFGFRKFVLNHPN